MPAAVPSGPADERIEKGWGVGRRATVMIWLTILIAALTEAILILTGVMVWKR